MAFGLTKTAQNALNQINKTPFLILEVEGLGDITLSSMPVFIFNRWDTEGIRWDEGYRWDGLTEDQNNKSYITFQGTSNRITQQLLPDKKGSGSIPTVSISLLNKNLEISKLLSLDSIEEVLGKKCDVYLGFLGTAHPVDSIPIFRGVITTYYTEPTLVNLSIQHPDALQRQSLQTSYSEVTTSIIDSTQTNIPVFTTNGFIASQDAVTSYIRIDDEIMLVNSFDGVSFEVVRGQFETIPVQHDNDSEVTGFYKLKGFPLQLALKIMLSDEGNTFFRSDDIPKSINFINPTLNIPNSIFFENYNIEESTGLAIGDIVRLEGVNAGDYTIQRFFTIEEGSYITVNEPLITEADYTGQFFYKSQFNVLPSGFGLGMIPSQVDVARHLNIDRLFNTSFTEYNFPIFEEIDDAKAFIEEEVYFPQGLFSIPRKARASVSYIAPPFTSDIVPTLNTKNITNIEKIKQTRSANKYLYNSIEYQYNYDEVEDKPKRKRRTISGDSVNRIKLGRKLLKIESRGLVDNAQTELVLDQLTRRYIDRYKFAPVYFKGIKLLLKDSANLEVGDVIPFGGADTQYIDLDTGKDDLSLELYQIINKSLDVKTGETSVDLLRTGYSINGRFAVISLSSKVLAGATTTRLPIQQILPSEDFVDDASRWEEFPDTPIRVRSDDYVHDQTVLLKGVDPQDRGFLLLDEPLSFVPQAGYIVEPPLYDDSVDQYKIRFTHIVYQTEITNVIDSSNIEVNDASKLVVGSEIYIRNLDFTSDSFDDLIKIESIVGNTITVEKPFPFTPVIGMIVERTDFLDEGQPYLLL